LTEIACDESGNPPNLKQIKWKKGRENREKKKRNPPIGQNPLFLWTFLKGEKCWTILTFYNTKKNKAMRKPPNLKQIKWKKGRENREKKKRNPPIGQNRHFFGRF